MFAISGVIVSTALLTDPDFSRLSDGLRACRDLFLIGPFRLIGDVARTTNIRALSIGLTLWFVPFAFGGRPSSWNFRRHEAFRRGPKAR